jgi:hypothetical protein
VRLIGRRRKAPPRLPAARALSAVGWIRADGRPGAADTRRRGAARAEEAWAHGRAARGAPIPTEVCIDCSARMDQFGAARATCSAVCVCRGRRGHRRHACAADGAARQCQPEPLAAHRSRDRDERVARLHGLVNPSASQQPANGGEKAATAAEPENRGWTVSCLPTGWSTREVTESVRSGTSGGIRSGGGERKRRVGR